MSFNLIRQRILGALKGHSGGSVYLKASVVPNSYPAAIYEYAGFKPTSKTYKSGAKGDYCFNLYLMEDVTDYAKDGDTWEEDGNAEFMEDILRVKVEALSEQLCNYTYDASEYDIYPGTTAGKDILIGKLSVRARRK
jgi:hypothetical protein